MNFDLEGVCEVWVSVECVVVLIGVILIVVEYCMFVWVDLMMCVIVFVVDGGLFVDGLFDWVFVVYVDVLVVVGVWVFDCGIDFLVFELVVVFDVFIVFGFLIVREVDVVV